jgi:hypothetical protein
LFSGGVVKNKKLQRGNIYVFEDILDQAKGMKGQKKPGSYKKFGDNPNDPNTEKIVKSQETVYLLKWLFPETSVKSYQKKASKGRFPKFSSQFLSEKLEPPTGRSSASQQTTSYWDRFEIIDDCESDEADESDDDDIDMKELEGRALEQY